MGILSRSNSAERNKQNDDNESENGEDFPIEVLKYADLLKEKHPIFYRKAKYNAGKYNILGTGEANFAFWFHDESKKFHRITLSKTQGLDGHYYLYLPESTTKEVKGDYISNKVLHHKNGQECYVKAGFDPNQPDEQVLLEENKVLTARVEKLSAALDVQMKQQNKMLEKIISNQSARSSRRTSVAPSPSETPKRRLSPPGLRSKINNMFDEKYDLKTNKIITSATIEYWKFAHTAACQGVTSDSHVDSLDDLYSARKKQILLEFKDLKDDDVFSFNSWLHRTRLLMIKHGINKSLFMEIVVPRLPISVQNIVTQRQSAGALRTEEDLIQALKNIIFSGIDCYAKKQEFIKKNKQAMSKGSADCQQILHEIQSKQAPLLIDVHPITPNSPTARNNMIEATAHELYIACLPQTSIKFLGANGAFNTSSGNLAAAASRFREFASESSLNAIKSGENEEIMTKLDALQNEVERLKKLLPGGKRIRICCNNCRVRGFESCYHCIAHSTDSKPILYRECQAQECIEKKKKAAENYSK